MPSWINFGPLFKRLNSNRIYMGQNPYLDLRVLILKFINIKLLGMSYCLLDTCDDLPMKKPFPGNPGKGF
jgi:hypothetical protein